MAAADRKIQIREVTMIHFSTLSFIIHSCTHLSPTILLVSMDEREVHPEYLGCLHFWERSVQRSRRRRGKRNGQWPPPLPNRNLYAFATGFATLKLKVYQIAYYVNNGNSVYCTFLDASKAFDRVEYSKLFRLLIQEAQLLLGKPTVRCYF